MSKELKIKTKDTTSAVDDKIYVYSPNTINRVVIHVKRDAQSCVWKPWVEVDSGWSGEIEYGRGSLSITPVKDAHYNDQPYNIKINISNIAISYDNKGSWNKNGDTNRSEDLQLNNSMDLYVWDKNNKLQTVSSIDGVVCKFDLSMSLYVNNLRGSVDNMYYMLVSGDRSAGGNINISYLAGSTEYPENMGSHTMVGRLANDNEVFYEISPAITYYIKFNSLPGILDEGESFDMPFKIVLNNSNTWESI